MSGPGRRGARSVLIAVGLLGACSTDPSSGTGADIGTAATTDSSSVVEPAPGGTAPGGPGPAPAGVRPEGFTTVTARITESDGDVCEVCLWLADTDDERARGLMGVTDLGDAVGMAFAFDEPGVGSFYMFRTPTPLTIAWFAPDGSLVATADMRPCLDTPAEQCPRYAPEQPYDLAVEVFDDGTGDPLAALGIGPGSRVELVAGSEAERCAVAAVPG